MRELLIVAVEEFGGNGFEIAEEAVFFAVGAGGEVEFGGWGSGWGWGPSIWGGVNGLWDVDALVNGAVAGLAQPWGDWAPPPFNYWGTTVIPVFGPDYQEWGFWVAGIWIPLPGQDSDGYQS